MEDESGWAGGRMSDWEFGLSAYGNGSRMTMAKCSKSPTTLSFFHSQFLVFLSWSQDVDVAFGFVTLANKIKKLSFIDIETFVKNIPYQA